MFHMERYAELFVCTQLQCVRLQMKRKTRVTSRSKIANLKASEGVEHYCSTDDREERRSYGQRMAELRRWRRLPKKRVTIDLDADVLAWFRELGPGYQWEINRALRKVMETEEKAKE